MAESQQDARAAALLARDGAGPPMRRAAPFAACCVALAAAKLLASALSLPAGGGLAQAVAQQSAAPATAQTALPRFREGYARWRRRLQRHGLYVGRDLLPQVRAADGGTRPPTEGELRRSIHRMQRRWERWLDTTARGRALRFALEVRRKVPPWGKRYLRAIAWCESRNNPRAIGGGGAYRGLYQFTVRTWYVVGGRGDPAAAPRHEQTWRAWLLLSRHGAGHWPVCG